MRFFFVCVWCDSPVFCRSCASIRCSCVCDCAICSVVFVVAFCCAPLHMHGPGEPKVKYLRKISAGRICWCAVGGSSGGRQRHFGSRNHRQIYDRLDGRWRVERDSAEKARTRDSFGCAEIAEVVWRCAVHQVIGWPYLGR